MFSFSLFRDEQHCIVTVLKYESICIAHVRQSNVWQPDSHTRKIGQNHQIKTLMPIMATRWPGHFKQGTNPTKSKLSGLLDDLPKVFLALATSLCIYSGLFFKWWLTGHKLDFT
jgi:hypothetical protein